MVRSQDWMTEEGLLLLNGWKREGRSLEEIAGFIGLQPDTLRRWMKRHPALNAALSVNAAATDFQVENALLKKALGYESVEKKVEISAKGERKEVETTKQVGPDMSAISFWLKKRKPQQWGEMAVGEAKPENNLNDLLEREGGFGWDEIPELQSTAEAGADLVAAE